MIFEGKDITTKVTKCNNQRCGLCEYIIDFERDCLTINNKMLHVKQNMDCTIIVKCSLRIAFYWLQKKIILVKQEINLEIE